jgi:hypothetical protein
MDAGELIAEARPWLAPYRAWLALLAQREPRLALTRAAAGAGARTQAGAPIQFAAADDAGAECYEAHIARTGRVPTRDDPHDLFNALAWIAFPRIKAALNAQHASRNEGQGPAPSRPRGRGRARDAATLLDENGLLLACSDPTVAEDLRAMRWQRLFVERRSSFVESTVPVVLGHALMDKLARPFKSICAHAWMLPVAPEVIGLPAGQRRHWLDRAFAARLASELTSPRMLAPLPVLGIPGWWPHNAQPDFYRDASVFRACRTRQVIAHRTSCMNPGQSVPGHRLSEPP